MSSPPNEPTGDAEFAALRESIIDRLEALPELQEYAWLAGVLLDFKRDYLGGTLAWSIDDVDEVLLGLFPAKTLFDAEDAIHVGPVAAALFRMLGQDQLISKRRAGLLADRAEAISDEVMRRAGDSTYWSPSKRIMMHGAGAGIDLEDPEELQRIMAQFNELPFEERAAITGDMSGPPTFAPLPPIELPAEAELEAEAESSRILRWLRTLVEYIGSGVAITPAGNLKLIDGKALNELMGTAHEWETTLGDHTYSVRSTTELAEIDMTYRIARATGVLARERNRAEPGPRVELLDSPLEAVEAAWLAIVDSSIWVADVEGGLGHRAESVWEDLVSLMSALFPGEAAIDELVSIRLASGQRSQPGEASPGVSESMLRSSFDWHTRACIDVLDDLGFVTVSGVQESKDKSGIERKAGGTVAATALGLWATQRYVSQFTSAPVVGRLRHLPAAEMLAATADLPDDEAHGELHAWLDEHGPAGIDALADQVHAASDTIRSQAWSALLHLGPPAAEAVAAISAIPGAAAHAAVWRAAVEGEGLFGLNPDGAAERFVDIVAAALDLFGTEAGGEWSDPAAGAAGIEAMIDGSWRLSDGRVGDVLGAIGQFHPNPAKAKLARKALFKFNSRSDR